MGFNAILSHYDQNSYLHIEQANEYFENHYEGDRWGDLEDSGKQKLLVMASTFLDGMATFGYGTSLFRDEPVVQALKYPTSMNLTITGTVDTGYAGRFLDSALADTALYRNDFFKWGAVRITAGTCINEIKTIDGFTVGTGEVSILDSDQFSQALDSTSQYTIVYPLKPDFVAMVCELALEIQRGGYAEIMSKGLPNHIRNLGRNYFDYRIRLNME